MDEQRRTAARLERLRGSIDRWRWMRRGGERMPERLWVRAAELAATLGVASVTRRLGLDYATLKSRLDDRASPQLEPAFIEMRGLQVTGGAAGETVITVATSDGAQLTIRVPGDRSVDLAALVASFRERR